MRFSIKFSDFEDLERFLSRSDSLGVSFSILRGVLVGTFIFVASVLLLQYVFNAISYSTIAKRRGLEKPYRAWIPFANTYLFGQIAEQFELAQYGKTRNHKLKMLLFKIFMAVSLIPFIRLTFSLLDVGLYSAESGNISDQFITTYMLFYLFYMLFFVFFSIYTVFEKLATYKVFRSCNPKTSVLFTILSLFISLFPSFALFAQRNMDEGFIALQQERS